MEDKCKGYTDNNSPLDQITQIDNNDRSILRRKRKKSNYKKINNETRQKLIEMVSKS
jgi:hypothetical protein